jgi:hypothetical protein
VNHQLGRFVEDGPTEPSFENIQGDTAFEEVKKSEAL